MSVPTKVVYCDKCDYRIGTVQLFLSYVYVTEEFGELNFYPTIGWCNACQSLRVVEDLSIKEHDLIRLVEQHQTLSDELRCLQDSFLGIVLQKHWNYSSWVLEKLTDTSKLLLHQLRRQGTDKCLKCGSTDIEHMDLFKAPLEIEPWPGNFKGSADTGHIHPGCGGQFIVHGADVRFIPSSKTFRYTAHGLLLDEMFN